MVFVALVDLTTIIIMSCVTYSRFVLVFPCAVREHVVVCSCQSDAGG